jgi:hypothetical protein
LLSQHLLPRIKKTQKLRIGFIDSLMRQTERIALAKMNRFRYTFQSISSDFTESDKNHFNGLMEDYIKQWPLTTTKPIGALSPCLDLDPDSDLGSDQAFDLFFLDTTSGRDTVLKTTQSMLEKKMMNHHSSVFIATITARASKCPSYTTVACFADDQIMKLFKEFNISAHRIKVPDNTVVMPSRAKLTFGRKQRLSLPINCAYNGGLKHGSCNNRGAGPSYSFFYSFGFKIDP